MAVDPDQRERRPTAESADRSRAPASWEEFLETHAETIFRVIRPFARTHGERMDLFLYACGALRANGMRRVRRFRYRAEAPCSFTTYLTVVVRNLALDYQRSRRGRFRLFANLASFDEADRMILRYRFREGRPLDEIRQTLNSRHGIRLDSSQLAERVAHVEQALSASQRWRLLSRRAWRQPTYRIDPVNVIAELGSLSLPLAAGESDPEHALGARDAERTFANAVASLPARQQLVLALRFRDGHDVATTARTVGLSPVQVEHLTRDALMAIRNAFGKARVTRKEMEDACGTWWRSWEGHG